MSDFEFISRKRDLLFAICIVSKPSSPASMSTTIRNHARTWEKAGIVPHIPVSSGFTNEQFRRFVQKHSEKDDSDDS